MSYITDAYARIQCTKCGNKLVDILKPGTPFDKIKECPCTKINDLTKLSLEELKELADKTNISYPSNIGAKTLITKLKGVKNGN